MTKHVVLRLPLILSLWVLTACSQQAIPNPSANSPGQQTSNNTQTPAVPGEKASSEGFLSAPIVAPPSFGNRPPKPGEMPRAETLPNGLPALKPLKGVNVDTLFSENITNTDRRFERLENAVVDMRREFETVKPAIVRLVAVEEDIQQMIEQLEAIASAPPPTPAPVYQPPIEPPQNLVKTDLQAPQTSNTHIENRGAIQATEPKPMPEKPATMAPTAVKSGPMVKNLRTGLHKDRVRLVLDMSTKTPYTVDLDSSENILVIELPAAGWAGTRSKTYGSKEPVLASYNVENINNGAGTRIIIPLKRASKVVKSALLPPGVTPNYRMYVDLSL